jgi:acetyl-CoA synthetase
VTCSTGTPSGTRSASGSCPYAKWFIGGKLNVAHNCLDRHVAAGRGDKVASTSRASPGDTRTITYAELLDETQRFANALKSLGVERGDRVNIYLPMIPEAAVAMLACARIGRAHSVVFGGFSRQALRDRINDAEAKVLITADGGYRRGEVFPLKPAPTRPSPDDLDIEHVVVVSVATTRSPWRRSRPLVPRPRGAADRECPAEPIDAEQLLFLLYTSGTTGKPKGHHAHERRLPDPGRVHPQYVFDLHPETDVYWCTADVGWVTGPQLHRLRARSRTAATQVMYEGVPNTPATTASGRSSRSTASRSSTPRRRRSGRS